MPHASQLLALLQHGDRRTVGRVADVVEQVVRSPAMTPDLVQCLFAEQDTVRMRAADALEKLSHTQAECLQPFAGVLLTLFEECEQQEVRWHLAVLLPRLRLNTQERQRAARGLQQCLAATSSIVKTFALQGLYDLSVQEPSLLPTVLDCLQVAGKNGTPAMKARSRKLLGPANKRFDRSLT